jgi:hypothetical protein
MGGGNKTRFKEIKYIQKACFGLECLEDGDPYIKIMI